MHCKGAVGEGKGANIRPSCFIERNKQSCGPSANNFKVVRLLKLRTL